MNNKNEQKKRETFTPGLYVHAHALMSLTLDTQTHKRSFFGNLRYFICNRFYGMYQNSIKKPEILDKIKSIMKVLCYVE